MVHAPKLQKFLVCVLFAGALLACVWTVVVLRNSSKDGTPPDLKGTWQGSVWGKVTLARAGPESFEGTYSSTYGKNAGRLSLSWNARTRQYEGTWAEGTYRHGQVWFRKEDGEDGFHGSYSADPDCEYRPGDPVSFEFRWSRGLNTESEDWGYGFRPSAPSF